MANSEQYLHIERQPRANERLRMIGDYKAVVIFGRSGSGQSSAGRALAERLGIPPEYQYDAGEDLRIQTGHTAATSHFMPRAQRIDKSVDDRQLALFRMATTATPAIVVAKLGGYLALKEELRHPDKREIFRVLLTCSPEEAARRIYGRKLDVIQANYARAHRSLDEGLITPEEFEMLINDWDEERLDLITHRAERIQQIIDDKHAKEIGDQEQWGKLYPPLRGIDVYDPEARVKLPKSMRHGHGKGTETGPHKLADATFASTYLTPYQTANKLVDTLIARGVVEKVELAPIKPEETKPNEEFPSKADIVILRRALNGQAS